MSDETGIFEAARNGSSVKIRMLLGKDKGLLTLKDDYGYTPFLVAAKAGHTDAVRCFLDMGAPPDQESEREEQTALHLAAMEGHAETVRALLDGGADPNSKDLEERTPLHLIATFKNDKILKILLEKGANPNETESYRRTPLHLMVESGWLDGVVTMLSHGAMAIKKDKKHRTPLHLAAEYGNLAMVELLLDQAKSSLTPAMRFITSVTAIFGVQDANIAEFINGRDLSKKTPLSYAREGAHKEIVSLLKRNGAK